MKRRPPASSRPVDRAPVPPTKKTSVLNSVTIAILAAVFILGIGIGVVFNSAANLNPQNVATREFIDQSAPNPEFCVNYGASAITMDTRVFVTFNPFNIYVSQPLMQPGCVMRSNNLAILEQRRLVSSEQLRECRQRLNTFGYTGNLDSTPQVNCIYQSDSNKNRFLNQPGVAGEAPPETNNF